MKLKTLKRLNNNFQQIRRTRRRRDHRMRRKQEEQQWQRRLQISSRSFQKTFQIRSGKTEIGRRDGGQLEGPESFGRNGGLCQLAGVLESWKLEWLKKLLIHLNFKEPIKSNLQNAKCILV